MSEIIPGSFIEVCYPFVLEEVELPPDDPEATGPNKVMSWRPGIRGVLVPPDESEFVADAEGTMILTVVSTHKPGRFPERVFFTRKWRCPKGREFGKPKLHIVTAEKFRRLARGYQHEYRLLDGDA